MLFRGVKEPINGAVIDVQQASVAKGKDAFSFRSYAKLLYCTNSLPVIKHERTNGVYRRMLVLTINNSPSAVNTNLTEEILSEIPYFVHLCMKALEKMYEEGIICISKHSKEAVQMAQCYADSVEAFIIDAAVRQANARTERTVLCSAYTQYCLARERKNVGRNELYQIMQTKGFSVVVSNGIHYFQGIALKNQDPSMGQIKQLPLAV